MCGEGGRVATQERGCASELYRNKFNGRVSTHLAEEERRVPLECSKRNQNMFVGQSDDCIVRLQFQVRATRGPI